MVNLYAEVIALKPGSEEVELVRKDALKGDDLALKKYLYYCALQRIYSDPIIPPYEKLKVFKALVLADLITFTMQQTAALSENPNG